MNKIQCKMARVALGWSASDLAAVSGATTKEITNIEVGRSVAGHTLEKVRLVFEAAGIQFTAHGERLGVTIPA